MLNVSVAAHARYRRAAEQSNILNELTANRYLHGARQSADAYAPPK